MKDVKKEELTTAVDNLADVDHDSADKGAVDDGHNDGVRWQRVEGAGGPTLVEDLAKELLERVSGGESADRLLEELHELLHDSDGETIFASERTKGLALANLVVLVTTQLLKLHEEMSSRHGANAAAASARGKDEGTRVGVARRSRHLGVVVALEQQDGQVAAKELSGQGPRQTGLTEADGEDDDDDGDGDGTL